MKKDITPKGWRIEVEILFLFVCPSTRSGLQSIYFYLPNQIPDNSWKFD